MCAVLLGYLLLQASALCGTAWAEGSKDLCEHGGYRPYTERYNAVSAGVSRLSEMRVFLQQGETLILGGSVRDAVLYDLSTNIGDYFTNELMGTTFDDTQLSYLNTADILVCGPSANSEGLPYFNGQYDEAVWLVDIGDSDTAAGYISNRAQEVNGIGVGGYAQSSVNTLTPPAGIDAAAKTDANVFIAPETGVYAVTFYSQAHTNENPTPVLVDGVWNQKGSTVAAWDISVLDASGTVQEGRTFADTLFLNMGANIAAQASVLESQMYVVTSDGYEYLVDFNGMDPYGFEFFANNRGMLYYTGEGDGHSLYHSVRSDDNALSDLSQHDILLNNVPSFDVDRTYHIFYNDPDEEVLVALGIPTSLTSDLGAIAEFAFTGTGSHLPDIGLVGAGGTFSFFARSDTSATSYQIELNFGVDNTVVLSNSLEVGVVNTIEWDGLDAFGNVVPAGVYGSRAISVKLKGGEVHFPLIDVETNNNGLIVQRLNGGGTAADKMQVFYNNSASNAGNVDPPWTLEGNWVVADRVDASEGVDSTDGALAYGDHVGDQCALDIWAYYDRPVEMAEYRFTLVDEYPPDPVPPGPQPLPDASDGDALLLAGLLGGIGALCIFVAVLRCFLVRSGHRLVGGCRGER